MEKVDCIVVGGGLAGLSAAYGLAAAGLEVMVLERGDYSGAKNVTGGRLYLSLVRDLYPELWAEAPLERPVARELITMIGQSTAATVEIAAQGFLGAPDRRGVEAGRRADDGRGVEAGPGAVRAQSATVVRAKLDQWLADRVAEKGAMVVTKMKVDEILREGARAGAEGAGASSGRVIGIRAGDDEIGADVVVIAEGVLGLLSTAAGLRGAPQAKDHALGYKEVIELPAATIEDRWHLNPGEGAAHLFMGEVTRGMTGGGFLYTNTDSISLGIVVAMEQMRSRGDELESWQLLDEFKEMPWIKPLVSGGSVAEYSAHAIAEGGIAVVPPLVGDGYVLVGDTAGLSLNALVTVRGMDMAIASGYQAARAIVAAKEARVAAGAPGGSSTGVLRADELASYESALRESFVLRDLETARAYPGIIENRRLFTHYPTAVGRLLEDVFTVGPGESPRLLKTLWRGVRRDFTKLGVLRDLWELRKL